MQDLHSKDSRELDELIEKVESEYEVQVEDVRAINHGFEVYTNIGPLLIEEEEGQETHLIYITGIYDYIRSSFKNIVEMRPARSGKFYLDTSRNFVIVKGPVKGKNRIFSYEGREKEYIKLLADFHRACEGYTPPSGGKAKTDWGRCIDKYKKEYRALKRYICSIKEKEVRSRFQRELLKRCDLYLKRMEESINILKTRGYLNIVEESMKRKQICIGNFKPSNYILIDDGIFIKSLNKCRYDIAERDIADLLIKLLQYRGGKIAAEVPEFLRLYHESNPLYPNSIDIIKAFIIYPDGYEKVCSRFYKGKSKWTEEAYVDKLYGAMEFEEEKEYLIHVLNSIELY